ncbi:uncharacterized protein LOC102748830 [Leptonychotes weddellii]|uniref:Uncharacterized protein LOC102748830 n=1 Tax=Leptonychotes weddellii TaxID=9713 RepID=A0A7F8QAJ3_LEPWE|nr:uncharacterized protein LOC102748830 [Leptonychotes weddellii]
MRPGWVLGGLNTPSTSPHGANGETEAQVVEPVLIPVPGPSQSHLPLAVWDPQAPSGPPFAALPGVSSAGRVCAVDPGLWPLLLSRCGDHAQLNFDLDRGMFPVVIQAVVDEGDVVEVTGHAHVLLAAFEKHVDGSFSVKPLKQKQIVSLVEEILWPLLI